MNHGSTLTSYDVWHNLGLAWDGPANNFEIWIDGVMMVAHSLPGSLPTSWGTSSLGGLGSAYNFALGEIHERILGNSSPYGVMFADLEIWNEYRARGGTTGPSPGIPEPGTLALLGVGLLGLGLLRRRTGT